MNPLRMFSPTRGESLRDKLSEAARKIEVHRRELAGLRNRLRARSRALYEATIRALERRDEAKAFLYSQEQAEVKKVVKTVTMGELALTQVAIRFESIRDMGDAMYHVSSAFKTIKKISDNLSTVTSAFERVADEVNTTLTETFTEVGNLAPDILPAPTSESGEELLEKAKRYVQAKAYDLNNSSSQTPPLSHPLPEDGEPVPLAAAQDGVKEIQLQPVPQIFNASSRVAERLLFKITPRGEVVQRKVLER